MVFHRTRLLWLHGFTGLAIILAHRSRSAQGAGPFHYDQKTPSCGAAGSIAPLCSPLWLAPVVRAGDGFFPHVLGPCCRYRVLQALTHRPQTTANQPQCWNAKPLVLGRTRIAGLLDAMGILGLPSAACAHGASPWHEPRRPLC